MNKRKRPKPTPRHSDARDLIAAAFRQHGALTIAKLHRLTGLHPAHIRNNVQPPQYKRVSCRKATRTIEWTWAINDDRCECGQLAAYVGTFQIMTGDGMKDREMFLCSECAQWADDGMTLAPL